MKSSRLIAPFTAIAVLGMQTQLHAEDVYVHLFETETLAPLTAPHTEEYAQSEHGINGERDGVLTFEFVNDDDIEVRYREGEASQRIGEFPKSVGNPINMYFLEKLISNMANTTGGSPFYIRNRLKASLLNDAIVTDYCDTLDDGATCYSFSPFENDEARERMGAFADLRIDFAIDENDPMRIEYMAARTADDGESYSLQLRKSE